MLKSDRRLFDRHPNKGAKNLLTISGSDTRGAGIQVGLFTGVLTAVVRVGIRTHRYVGKKADLKTFAAHGCYGSTVITALTARNTTSGQNEIVHPCTPEFVANQMRSVLDNSDIHAIKLGMLYDFATARKVARTLQSCFKPGMTMPPLICDPVCISTSGQTFLHHDAIEFMTTRLFPMATLITPSKTEAKLFLAVQGISQKVETLDDMLIAAELLLRSVGGNAVLLKAGHFSATMSDVIIIMSAKRPDFQIIKYGLYGENMEILIASHQDYSQLEVEINILHQASGEKTLFVHPRINSSSTEGERCTLSSAIACEIALGCNLKEAVKNAIAYTHLGIEVAQSLGKGHGPIDHFHSITSLSIPPRTLTDPYPLTHLLIQSNSSVWKQYVEHDFGKQLGQGTLNRSCFVHFGKQDYHYLKYYARAYALLGAKSSTFTLIHSSTQAIFNILHEVGTHKSFCNTFGVTPEELANTPESTATTAYGAYLIDVGLRGDTMTLTIALTASLLGFGEVGLWLQKESKKENSWVIIEGNPYKLWIDDCSGEIFQTIVKEGLEAIECCAAADPPSSERLAEWVGVWGRCAKLQSERLLESLMIL